VGVAQVEWKVERPDHADHTVRRVAQDLAGCDRSGHQILLGQTARELEAREQGLDLGLGLAAQLAGLEHDRVGQRGRLRGDRGLPALEVSGALGQRQLGPCRLGGGGGPCRIAHRGRGVPGLEHDRAIRRRIARHQRLAGRRHELAADEVAESLHGPK